MLIENGYVKSKSEFLRLINQGGIQLNCVKIGSELLSKVVNNNDVLKIGKKKFIRLKII
jgi:tyrosyl-tRNA synthetase